MTRKSLLAFIAGLVFFYALVSGGLKWLNHKQKNIVLRQTNLIQENVKERFKIFLDAPLSIGMAGADYFSSGNLHQKDYGPHAHDILKLNKEILGLNLMDKTGTIIRVFPPEVNPHTVGKVSQNYRHLLEHYKQGGKFWFSAPFKLYQGELGFVIYVPITENKKLKGWFAPVISSKLFFEKFKLNEFLSSFDLIIKDEASRLDYYATAMLPDNSPKVYESHIQIMGRNLLFQMWRKDGTMPLNIPWYMIFGLSVILAGLLVYIVNLYFLRRKDRRQLEDISILLKLTAKDALNKLLDDQVTVESRDDFITNLLEQINLLQSMANTGEGPDQSELLMAPLIQEQIENLEDLKLKKALNIQFKSTDFSNAKVFTNKWLLQNCIFGNILVHSILSAETNSSIYISMKSDEEEHVLSFHTSKATRAGGKDPFAIDRRLEVTRKVLALYKGEFLLQHDLSEGLMIRMILPRA